MSPKRQVVRAKFWIKGNVSRMMQDTSHRLKTLKQGEVSVRKRFLGSQSNRIQVPAQLSTVDRLGDFEDIEGLGNGFSRSYNCGH